MEMSFLSTWEQGLRVETPAKNLNKPRGKKTSLLDYRERGRRAMIPNATRGVKVHFK